MIKRKGPHLIDHSVSYEETSEKQGCEQEHAKSNDYAIIIRFPCLLLVQSVLHICGTLVHAIHHILGCHRRIQSLSKMMKNPNECRSNDPQLTESKINTMSSTMVPLDKCRNKKTYLLMREGERSC